MDIPLSITAFIILSPERHIVVTLNKTASVQNREKKPFPKNQFVSALVFWYLWSQKIQAGKTRLLKFFQMNTILAWNTRLVRGLRFKTKSFKSRAVDER